MEERNYLLILGCISFITCWLDIIKIKRAYKLIIFVGILIFALYCGVINFPNSVDYDIYDYMYFRYAPNELEFNFENDLHDYGYVWFNTVVKFLEGNLETVYFVNCLIVLIIYFFVFKNLTPYIFSTWYFLFARFFEMQNIIQIRQGLATAIMLLSLKYVYENKLLNFMMIILIAALIHKSLLVALLIYPISKINWTKEKIISVICFCILVYFFPITNLIFRIILPTLGIDVPKFEAYSGGIRDTNIGFFEFWSRLIIVAVFSYVLLKWKDFRYKSIFISMLLLGLFFEGAFSDFAALTRVTAIFFVVFSFIPAVLLDLDTFKKNKIEIMCLIVMIGALFIIKNYVLLDTSRQSTGVF